MKTVKLVDILARELRVWPADDMVYARQDWDKEVRFFGLDGDQGESAYDFYAADRADDGCEEATYAGGGIKVTRAQWQAAVDAMKAAENVASAWNGEGFPPVGVDALLAKECKFTEGTRLESFPAGTVVYVGGRANFGGCDLAVIIIKGRHFCGTIIPELLNPIRTPEQIAADERDKAIDDLLKVTCINRGEAARIYDAGYRKQVAP